MPSHFRLTARYMAEHEEQVALFRWAAISERTDPRLKLLNASQNGLSASSIGAAARAKAAGMKAGYPDVFLPVPSQGMAGLYIEMKRRDGVPSDVSAAQRWWLTELRGQGKSQTELAALFDISDAAVSKWLKTGKVSRDRLPVLARFLAINLQWLAEGKGPMVEENNIQLRYEQAPEAIQGAINKLLRYPQETADVERVVKVIDALMPNIPSANH